MMMMSRIRKRIMVKMTMMGSKRMRIKMMTVRGIMMRKAVMKPRRGR